MIAGTWDWNIELESRASFLSIEGGSGKDTGFARKEKCIPKRERTREKGPQGEFRVYGKESRVTHPSYTDVQ